MKGKVKFFNDMKGFGFIAGDDGKEYFVHISGIKDGVELTEGLDVEFEIEQGDRGPKAANVKLAGASSDDDSYEDEPEASDEESEDEDKE